MNLRKMLFICCFALIYSDLAIAAGGISVGGGSGTKDVQGYRVGFQRTLTQEGITPQRRRVTGYWELAFTQMHNPITYSFPTNNDLEATSFSLVLRLPLKICLQWYFDIGIGITYLTNQEISTRNLGTKWLFEDRLGAGVLLGPRLQYEIGYRLLHYSNGYLAQVNQGLNLHMLILGYWLQ